MRRDTHILDTRKAFQPGSGYFGWMVIPGVQIVETDMNNRPETAWLVEAVREGYPPVWLAVNCKAWLWTEDASKAIRFARESDAKAAIQALSLFDCVATEHQWG